MTGFMKKILYILLGLYAGLFTWGTQELLLDYYQGSYFWLNLLHGASTGLIFGFLLGSAEGIAIGEKKKAVFSGLIGLGAGILGGAVSFFLASYLLVSISNAYNVDLQNTITWLMPLTRTGGWAAIGMVLGLTEGLRSRSMTRLIIGILGGLLGGLVGGALLEFSLQFFEVGVLGRFVGFAALGLMLGFWFGDFEARFAYGRLKVLSGPLKNKEYLLSRSRTKLGTSTLCDVYLKLYEGVQPLHAVLRKEKEVMRLDSGTNPGTLLVNDDKITDSLELKYEDVIQVGKVKLLLLPL
jgi:hypothetical protein